MKKKVYLSFVLVVLINFLSDMTKGYALYRIWNLAADAIDAGGNPDFIIGKMDYIYKADVSKAETDGQLLAALEEVEPKWYSLTKPLDATRS